MFDELVVYELVQHEVVLVQKHQQQQYEMIEHAYFFGVLTIDNSNKNEKKKSINNVKRIYQYF